jgi:hypothetical protein
VFLRSLQSANLKIMIANKFHISDFSGVSLVAYFYNKPTELQQLILDLQQHLQMSFANNFIPYNLKQVHATIIGCEGIKTEKGIINQWFYTLRNEVRYIDYYGLFDYFLKGNILPLDIYFGGYKPKINYQFLSRNQHPSDRSFQLQVLGKNTFIPVLMGWSMENNVITTKIEQIRRDLQQFNYLHKYHQSSQDIDNDFYLRLGTITGNFTSDFIINIQQKINYYLQNATKNKISLDRANLDLVKYQDSTLPIATTEIYSLSYLKENRDLIQHLIQQLYE